MEQMLIVGQAVRGACVGRWSASLPVRTVQEGPKSAVRTAIRLVKGGRCGPGEAGRAADFPEAVAAVTRAGIPSMASSGSPADGPEIQHRVRAQSGAGSRAGGDQGRAGRDATRLQEAGAIAAQLHQLRADSGPEGRRISVSIPVLGGFGGGRGWTADRMVNAAIGYAASALDNESTPTPTSRGSPSTRSGLRRDVRAGRQIKAARHADPPVPEVRCVLDTADTDGITTDIR